MAKSFSNDRTIIMPREEKIVEKFINYIMKDWKKSIARKIFSNTMWDIKKSGHMNPIIVLRAAIENASPNIMIKSARIWGSVYQVPIELKSNRKMFFSCKWLLESARSKKWKAMYKKLAEEILAAYSDQWYAVKKKEDAQRMADANKAFAYMAKYVR